MLSGGKNEGFGFRLFVGVFFLEGIKLGSVCISVIVFVAMHYFVFWLYSGCIYVIFVLCADY